MAQLSRYIQEGVLYLRIQRKIECQCIKDHAKFSCKVRSLLATSRRLAGGLLWINDRSRRDRLVCCCSNTMWLVQSLTLSCNISIDMSKLVVLYLIPFHLYTFFCTGTFKIFIITLCLSIRSAFQIRTIVIEDIFQFC